MSITNFELVTDLQSLNRRDFASADNNILNPLNVRPLIDGEWLQLDTNYKLARGGDNDSSSADEGTTMNTFVVTTERGRYDVQAIQKINVLFLGQYEAETSVCDTTGASLGSALTVQDITLSGVVRRALKAEASTSGRVIVGYVSKLPGGGKLRFIHMSNRKV